MSLKRYLFNVYGILENKRIKNIDKIDGIYIDDRLSGNMNSKGKLYSYFCSISLQITEKTLLITDDKCLLKLWNVPFNDAIQKYVLSCNGTFSDIRYERNIFIEFEASNTKILRELAMLIEDITKPGARYNVPSYKYVCPRTAYSLIRLADYLDDFYKDN